MSAESHPELPFGRLYLVERASRDVIRAMQDAVDVVGLLAASGACECERSDLAKALRGAEGRYLRIEWVLAIAAVSPADARGRIVKALIGWLGLEAVEAEPMDPEEKAARFEAQLRTLGALGEKMIDDALRPPATRRKKAGAR